MKIHRKSSSSSSNYRRSSHSETGNQRPVDRGTVNAFPDIQAKLNVSQKGDASEVEADNMAASVMKKESTGTVVQSGSEMARQEETVYTQTNERASRRRITWWHPL